MLVSAIVLGYYCVDIGTCLEVAAAIDVICNRQAVLVGDSLFCTGVAGEVQSADFPCGGAKGFRVGVVEIASAGAVESETLGTGVGEFGSEGGDVGTGIGGDTPVTAVVERNGRGGGGFVLACGFDDLATRDFETAFVGIEVGGQGGVGSEPCLGERGRRCARFGERRTERAVATHRGFGAASAAEYWNVPL